MKAMKGEVTHLYAYITEDEGIAAVYLPSMGWAPAMTYDPKVAKLMRPAVEAIAKAAGKQTFFVTAEVVSADPL